MRERAFVTFVIRNDSYIPGALVLAHALRDQETCADLVCLVTAHISPAGRSALKLEFDRVIVVDALVCGPADQRRQYVDQVLTRVNALRLGPDGDLGCSYGKIVLLDADVLPLRCYDHLFLVDAPAGIINERSDLFKRTDSDRRYVTPGPVTHGRWQWHHHYRYVPHGAPIPRSVTDRVLTDPGNYGINAALLVLEPSMREYERIRVALESGTAAAAYLPRFRWPDMQFLTAFWSGRWRNVDLCFAGLSGYPDIGVLFGTHFAGPKPWAVRHQTVRRRFCRYPDFSLWYREYLELIERHPCLLRRRSYARLAAFARTSLGRFDPTGADSYVPSRRSP